MFRHYDRDYFPDANNLVTYLNDFRAHYSLNVKFNMSVKYIYRSDDLYCLKTVNEDIFYCRYLVIATGRSEEYIPEFPGVELAENYSKISVDPNAYEGKRVMIIGKGNSAFETADNMMSKASVIHMCSPNSIRLAWKTHYVGHLRAVNNSFLDTYQLKSGNTVLDAQVLKIQKRSQDTNQISVTIKYTHAEDQKRDILADKVILCTGFKFDISMFDNSVKPELLETGKFPAINTRWESINQPHMYFAGNLMHGLDDQKTFSGFIHGFRYNVQCLARLLAEKYHNFDWPSKKISMEPSSFSREILDRMNRSSSLYQQPGFIGDVVGILENCDCARHYQDVPLNLIKEEGWKAYREYWLLFMDYGHKNILDPFNVDRFPFSKGGAHESTHPSVSWASLGIGDMWGMPPVKDIPMKLGCGDFSHEVAIGVNEGSQYNAARILNKYQQLFPVFENYELVDHGVNHWTKIETCRPFVNLRDIYILTSDNGAGFKFAPYVASSLVSNDDVLPDSQLFAAL